MRRLPRYRRLDGLTLLVAAALVVTPALAGDANPYTKPDESWISISGTVEAVGPDAFTLDYGDATVTVEMDDGDRDADGYKLVRGDKVTVYGVIDDDLFETTSIEASSVYVENLNTYFYASSVDEEDVGFVTYWGPLETSRVHVQGYVTDIDGREFTVNSGHRSIRVDTKSMPFNPMDDEGYFKIELGDRVSVSGKMEDSLFDSRELRADTVVDLVS